MTDVAEFDLLVIRRALGLNAAGAPTRNGYWVPAGGNERPVCHKLVRDGLLHHYSGPDRHGWYEFRATAEGAALVGATLPT